MSVDYTRPSDGEPSDSESPMFAGSPIWERGRKYGRGRNVSARSMFDREDDSLAPTPPAEPRSFRTDAARDDILAADGRPAAAAGPVVEDERPFVTSGARTVVRRNRSVAPAAAAVGLIALAALAATGWYMSRPDQLAVTPGGPSAGGPPATSVAAAPTGGADTLAANTPPPEAAAAAATTPGVPAAATTTVTRHSVTTTSRTTTPAVRHRASARLTASPEQPVTSPSATGAGVNTAATAPAGMNQSSAGAVPSTPSTAAPPPALGSTSPPVNSAPQNPTPAPAPSTTTPDIAQPGATTSPQASGSPQ